MSTPQAVLDALEKLDASDKDVVTTYINGLQAKLMEAGVPMEMDEPEAEAEPEPEPEPTMEVEEEEEGNDEPPFPPLYESGNEDMEKAGALKQEAADLKASGDWEGALEKYTAAVQAAPPSALLYANRATALLKLDRPRAAERDCNEALRENPDSAKALRVRGKARKALGQWETALKDLSASQQIDFDEGTVEDLKFLTEKHVEQEKKEAADRIEKEEKLRKKAEDIKKAQEEAKKEAEKERAEAGGMPGGGMPGGGMPGGGMPPGMDALFSDPEIVAGLQNPKVQAAFQELMGSGGAAGLMSNPQKMQEMMSDPEVGPVIKKIIAKMGGGAMGGGMPGAAGAGEGDGVPNMDEMGGDVDLDDLPDLE